MHKEGSVWVCVCVCVCEKSVCTLQVLSGEFTNVRIINYQHYRYYKDQNHKFNTQPICTRTFFETGFKVADTIQREEFVAMLCPHCQRPTTRTHTLTHCTPAALWPGLSSGTHVASWLKLTNSRSELDSPASCERFIFKQTYIQWLCSCIEMSFNDST